MKIRPINLKEAKVIEAKFIRDIESKLEKARIKQEKLKKNNAPKYAIEKLQKRIEEIERDLKNCRENPISKNDL